MLKIAKWVFLKSRGHPLSSMLQPDQILKEVFCGKTGKKKKGKGMKRSAKEALIEVGRKGFDATYATPFAWAYR